MHFPYDTSWTPVSEWVRGCSPACRSRHAGVRHLFLWWHSVDHLGVPLLSPYSKHLHIGVGGFTCCSRRSGRRRAQADGHQHRGDVRDDTFGRARRSTTSSWKQLLDTMTCTECGAVSRSAPRGIAQAALSQVLVDGTCVTNCSRMAPSCSQQSESARAFQPRSPSFRSCEPRRGSR